MTSGAKSWRATVLTLFPTCSRVRSASAWRARRWRPDCGRWRRGISGPRPPTAIAASTTPRPAAAPAWCCAPTCWRMPSDAAGYCLGSPKDRPRLLMSPRGRPLTQSRVVELANGPGPLIVCGRFEGIDQRVIEARRLEEVSIGDYVLSGGEIASHGADRPPASRLLPGVMGKLACRETRTGAFPTVPYWISRNIPARRSSRAGRFRKSSLPATMPRWRPGGRPRPRP